MLQGVVINLIVFALILVIVPLTNLDQKKIEDNINLSTIGKYLYNENIILRVIK